MNDAQATAWRAASEFVLLVIALCAAAREDPRTWMPALDMLAADPMLLATALVMTAVAGQAAVAG